MPPSTANAAIRNQASQDAAMPDRVFDAIVSAVQRSGYRIVIGKITNEFLEFQMRADKKKYSNPELDPTLHDLDDNNSFWIEIKDREGDTIGTIAGRLCQIDSLISLCRSYRFWYGDKISFSEPLAIVYADHDRIPQGRVVYDGAMWIRPDHRKRGISWALSRLCRLTAIRMWEPAWIFGFGFPAVSRARLPTSVYGYPHHQIFADGFKVPGYPAQSIFLATMTAAEARRSAAEDELLLADHPGLMFDEAFAEELKRARETDAIRARISENAALPCAASA